MQLDARNPQVFRATVVDVRNYGLLIELPDVVDDGLDSRVLADGRFLFSFQAPQRRLLGRQSRRRFSHRRANCAFTSCVSILSSDKWTSRFVDEREKKTSCRPTRSLNLSAILVRICWSRAFLN